MGTTVESNVVEINAIELREAVVDHARKIWKLRDARRRADPVNFRLEYNASIPYTNDINRAKALVNHIAGGNVPALHTLATDIARKHGKLDALLIDVTISRAMGWEVLICASCGGQCDLSDQCVNEQCYTDWEDIGLCSSCNAIDCSCGE